MGGMVNSLEIVHVYVLKPECLLNQSKEVFLPIIGQLLRLKDVIGNGR